MSLEIWAVLAIVVAALALIYAVINAKRVIAKEVGTDEMRSIMELIQMGAMAFLKREYSVLVWFVAAVAAIIAIVGVVFDVSLGWQTSMRPTWVPRLLPWLLVWRWPTQNWPKARLRCLSASLSCSRL